MHTEVLSPDTQPVFVALAASPFPAQFYLAGGTGLALQYGHRESIDLDFFTSQPFDGNDLKKYLASVGTLKILREDAKTVHADIAGAKASFFEYRYPLLYPPVMHGGVPIANARDIAAMKLDVISRRGAKKDFIDLWALLQRYSLAELLDFFTRRFEGVEYNYAHLLKSLTYFNDAEAEPMPLMLVPAEWEEIKKEITEKAAEFMRSENRI